MFRVRGLMDAVGAIFALIALYLVLRGSVSATRIIDALADGGGSLIRILQARG